MTRLEQKQTENETATERNKEQGEIKKGENRRKETKIKREWGVGGKR
jgi:hypothetical protein